MAKNITRMVQYARDPKSNPDPGFARLRAVIADAKSRNMVALMTIDPQSLGDTLEELRANLDAIADADLAVMFVPTKHRS
jgi:hypothetical protein